jgi:hypothetical protein
MRYELKHDKLAAQIFVRASAAAKARRRAGEIYGLYAEIGAERLFSADELLYLQQFLQVLAPSDQLQQYILQSQKGIEASIAAEKIEAERRARAEEKAQRAEEEARLRQVAEKARRRAIWGTILAVGLAILAIILGISAFQQRNQAIEQKKIAESSEKRATNLAKDVGIARDSAIALRKIAERKTQETADALEKLSQETAAKEQLQFSNKVDIVQSFVNAGYCELAQKALKDLMPLVNKYRQRAEFQVTARELQEQVNQCKPLNTQK